MHCVHKRVQFPRILTTSRAASPRPLPCTGVTVPARLSALAGQNQILRESPLNVRCRELSPPSGLATRLGTVCSDDHKSQRVSAAKRRHRANLVYTWNNSSLFLMSPAKTAFAVKCCLAVLYTWNNSLRLPLYRPILRRRLSCLDKRLRSALSPERFLLPVRKGHRSQKTLSRRDIKPVSGGTHVGMTNTTAAAFRRGHYILNHGIVMSSANSPEVLTLLTLRQAASRIAVCRRTLERLIASGKFPPPLKIGRSSRIPESDVNAYVAKLIANRGAS